MSVPEGKQARHSTQTTINLLILSAVCLKGRCRSWRIPLIQLHYILYYYLTKLTTIFSDSSKRLEVGHLFFCSKEQPFYWLSMLKLMENTSFVFLTHQALENGINFVLHNYKVWLTISKNHAVVRFAAIFKEAYTSVFSLMFW